MLVLLCLRIDFICQLNWGFSSPALVADCLFLTGHRARRPDREPVETILTIFTLSRLGWPRFCIWKFRVWKESCHKYPKKITGCIIQWWVSGKENICAESWNHNTDIWLRAVSYSQQRLFIRGTMRVERLALTFVSCSNADTQQHVVNMPLKLISATAWQPVALLLISKSGTDFYLKKPIGGHFCLTHHRAGAKKMAFPHGAAVRGKWVLITVREQKTQSLPRSFPIM